MKKKVEQKTEIEIQEIQVGQIAFCVLGTTPLIVNRLAEKARQELLLPAMRKNNAERASTLKHDPVAEFRSAMYRDSLNQEEFRCYMPGGAFGKALASAALDIPGASKAQIERLVKVDEVNVGIYGLPKLYMSVVRQSDIGHTPDIRTRAIFPEWAAYVTIRYVRSLVSERTVANLFAAAGIIVGIGDHRGQKSGSYGAFKLVSKDDKLFAAIVRTQGRKAQDEAIENPEPYDAESEELLGWFLTEAVRREKRVTTAGNNGIRNRVMEAVK